MCVSRVFRRSRIPRDTRTAKTIKRSERGDPFSCLVVDFSTRGHTGDRIGYVATSVMPRNDNNNLPRCTARDTYVRTERGEHESLEGIRTERGRLFENN